MTQHLSTGERAAPRRPWWRGRTALPRTGIHVWAPVGRRTWSVHNVTVTDADTLRILEETGVVRRGHFLLTSGLHTNLFLLCAQVQQFPRQLERLAAAMAEPFRAEGVEVVIGPAMGGVILAYEVARALDVRAIFAEKDGDGGMVLRRGFRVRPGERVLVVEDAITTGGSVRRVVDAVRRLRGHVVGVSAIVDRSAGRTDVGAPARALLTLDVPAWDPSACPLCREGVPLVEPKDVAG